MVPFRPSSLILVCCLALSLTAACGGTGSASLSPAAPSPAAAPSSSGATIAGQVTGPLVTGRSLSVSDAGISHTMDSRGITVSIVGTSVSTTTDGAGQFTLTNVPGGTVQLNFSAPGSSATVTISGVGATDRVQIVVSLSGNSARVESEHHSAPDNKGEFQGRITSIDVPGRSFQVSGTTIKVPVAAVIRHGSRAVAFADLKVGDHVEVRGTRDGATITATEVKVESDDQGDDDDEDDEKEGKDGKGKDGGSSSAVEVSGAIAAFAGTCPAVTFMLQNTKVVASNATVYEDGTCAGLKNDVRVEVRGTKATDGSIIAARIEIQPAKDALTVEVSGTISTLAGTCPAVSFVVRETKVTAVAATAYEHGSCAALKNGLKVEVKGTKGPDGMVTATRISIDD